MKLSCAVLLFYFIITLVCAADKNKYTNKYDNVDIDQILNNRRVLTNYIKCVMEEGPCTPDGRELKSKFVRFIIFYIKE